MINIGEKIKEKRLALGYTQAELAKKVGYKNTSSITKIETQRDIPLKKLKPIANALEIDVRTLIEWDDEEEDQEEKILLRYYRELNQDAKQLVLSTARMLMEKGDNNDH